MKSYISTILTAALAILLFSSTTYAQKQANVWYFGNKAGLDFNTGTPIPLMDGELNTQEGCATISDSNGQLLFYTNGVTVWNKQHSIMQNGIGLSGDFSSSQSAIIIPKPLNDSIYYIFTVDTTGRSRGVQYSEVDLTLNNGLGAITTTKNIKLRDSVCEKICAVYHGNYRDVWLMVHGSQSDEFICYLVTPNGISNTPVVSNVGTDLFQSAPINTIGCMKASPDGSFVAIAHSYENFKRAELLEFDHFSGALSNPIILGEDSSSYDGLLGPYGVEFSPRSNFVYVAESDPGNTSIYQYDLHATDIPASEQEIGEITGYNCGALQLAPNGKVYAAVTFSNLLGVINAPDSAGTDANLVTSGINLGSGMTRIGLPSFIASYFNCLDVASVDLGNDTTLCVGKSKSLGDGDTTASYQWSSGDSGNFLTIMQPGTYSVIKTKKGCESVDTITIQYDSVPEFSFGNDTSICIDSTLLLQVELQNTSFLWQDGSTNAFLKVGSEGEYWLLATNGVCTHSDTINVEVDSCLIEIPNIFTPNDDGYNDLFFISHLQEGAQLHVYNRWGKLIFDDANYDNNWTADNISDGLYFYKLSWFGTTTSYEGWVQVLR